MTNKEFSNEFDIMFNNIMSNQAPGISLYEKSVFLTKAQNDLVTKYFMEKDYMLKREFDFNPLIRTKVFNSSLAVNPNGEILDRGKWFPVRDLNILYVLNERFRVIDRVVNNRNIYKYLSVRPISQMEYVRLVNRIDKNPPKNEVWRIFDVNSSDTHKDFMNLIYPNYYQFANYEIKYVVTPYPIILEDLRIYNVNDCKTVSVDGKQVPLGFTTDGVPKDEAGEPINYNPEVAYECCELPQQLHRLILDLAVAYAKQAWND